MPRDILESVQGTLEFLILRTLLQGPMHGYAIARWILDNSGEELAIEEGTLYPALHRMEDKDLIEATWGLSYNNRKAKYYSLTPAGRRELRERTARWKRYARAVTMLLDAST
jgi:transcriptional regulator